ncbi:MAG: hypothetical protein SAJ12_03390 [Jaaginema sp. PMC 1079.18]|nr:hypothetical protein [Jaaginema sp. PMC 1080.18]MEC4850032.1 hypothetical protein [Jaaginema sp. PMC 1079.18]MEC4867438.1 hypothetical protein [Jaaginema sp. PMC 1078.18]
MESTIMAIAVVVLCGVTITNYFAGNRLIQGIIGILGLGIVGVVVFGLFPQIEIVLLLLIAVFTGFQLMTIATKIKPQNRLPYFLGTIALDRLLMLSVPQFWMQLPYAVRTVWTYSAIAFAIYLAIRFSIRLTLKNIFLRR